MKEKLNRNLKITEKRNYKYISFLINLYSVNSAKELKLYKELNLICT